MYALSSLTIILFHAISTYATSSSPIHVTAPTPSPYPSSACVNEPRYLNFNFNDSVDKKKAAKLHDVFCNDWNALMTAGAEVLEVGKRNRTIIRRYFNLTGTGKNDGIAIASSAWNRLFDYRSGQATDLVSKFILDNEDFLALSGERLCGGSNGVAAYTAVDQGDNREKVHVCRQTYNLKLPNLSALTCKSLGGQVSDKMESFARIVLHEFFHYKAVGQQSLVGNQIIDVKNKDGLYALLPERVHGLLAQDKEPEKARDNADNYAWLATVCVESVFRLE